MENQAPPNLEIAEKATETTKRKRKLLNDPERMWAECRVCKEPGNLENMLYLKVPFSDSQNQVLYGCFEGIYFCSENCQGLFT